MIKVANIMLSRGLGGIEQVFLDYDHALRIQNAKVVSIFHPKAQIASRLKGHCKALRAFSQYDLLAALKLRNFVRQEDINVVITHGNRAARIAQLARLDVPVISVSHNYKYRPLRKSQSIIAITDQMRDEIVSSGYPKGRCYKLNNPICPPSDLQLQLKPFFNPPVIGFMGRFVAKKGVVQLLLALKILQARGLKFRAIIAGDGPQAGEIAALYRDLQLGGDVEIRPWVDDKESFFEELDIMVVPSIEEPFGVVILEAFIHSKPVVSTMVAGPMEIITNGHNGRLIEPGNPEKLADALAELLQNEELAHNFAMQGFKRAGDFDILSFSRALQRIIEEVKYKYILESSR